FAAIGGGVFVLPALAGTYEDRLAAADAKLQQGKLAEAISDLRVLELTYPSRYEAFAGAAIALSRSSRQAEAIEAFTTASKLAPVTDSQVIAQVSNVVFGAGNAGPPKVVVPNVARPPGQRQATDDSSLSRADLRQYDILFVILDEASEAKSELDRAKRLKEFLDQSGPFLNEHPNLLALWAMRASAALELGARHVTWQAGQNLIALGAADSKSPTIRKLLARLDRKGWLTATEPVGYDSGRVVYWYDNGWYIGNTAEGTKNGFGNYYWNSGDRYEGDWHEGKKSGSGNYYFS